MLTHLSSLPTTLDHDQAALVLALIIGFFCIASIMGGLYRTIFLIFMGARLARLLVLTSLLGSGAWLMGH